VRESESARKLAAGETKHIFLGSGMKTSETAGEVL